MFWNKKQLLHKGTYGIIIAFSEPSYTACQERRKEPRNSSTFTQAGLKQGGFRINLGPLCIYGKITHVHLPYKSVTGRHTYIIYLMLFNIHAYLGFIQFIKFSVWPAEERKTEADVSSLPPFNVHQSPAQSGTGWKVTFVSTSRSPPRPDPPSHREVVCP